MDYTILNLFSILKQKLSGNILKKIKIKLLNFQKKIGNNIRMSLQIIKLRSNTRSSDCLNEKLSLPVYYINLERKKSRNLNILNNLAPFFKDVNRVEAIDGFKLQENCFNGKIDLISYDFSDFSQSHNCFEVACLLSHFKVIQIINEKDLDYALVLEDDISLEFISKWEECLDEIILNCPNDFDILKLHFPKHKILSNLKLFNKNLRYRKLDSTPNREWSTAAMIYSKKGIKSMISKFDFENLKLSREQYQLLVADYVLFKGMTVYEYTKPLFKTFNDVSSIRPEWNHKQDLMNKIISKIYR